MSKGRFVIAECPRCHSLLIADSRYTTKTCPKCDARLEIESLVALKTAKDSREARNLLSEAKANRGG